MKLQIFTSVALACAAAAFAAQTASKPSPAAEKPGSANQTLTLNGCVAAGATATDPFTLTHPTLVRGTGPSAVTVINGTVSGAVSAESVSAAAGVPPAGAGAKASPTLAMPRVGWSTRPP